jgi:hypothetical protein
MRPIFTRTSAVVPSTMVSTIVEIHGDGEVCADLERAARDGDRLDLHGVGGLCRPLWKARQDERRRRITTGPLPASPRQRTVLARGRAWMEGRGAQGRSDVHNAAATEQTGDHIILGWLPPPCRFLAHGLGRLLSVESFGWLNCIAKAFPLSRFTEVGG